jgi:hypothetical protein
MTHQLTIDQSRCHGLENCKACERIAPGLVAYCADNGHVLIGEWAMVEKSAMISRLVVFCSARAIVVRPV